MTICVAMNFGAYALLAADTRTQWGDPPIWVEDGKSKVHETPLGIITGAGLTQALDAVRLRLESAHVEHTAHIRQIIHEEHAAAMERFKGQPVDRWLARTGWFFTYVTVVDGTSTLRLGLIHGNYLNELAAYGDGALYHVPPGEARIIAPGEATEAEADELHERLARELRPISDFPTAQDHFDHHRALAGTMVAVAASRYRSVSCAMSVGVHTLDGNIQVSAPVDVPAMPD